MSVQTRPTPFLQYFPSDGGALRVTLDPLPFRIGRGENSHLHIPSPQVSKEHAEILHAGSDFLIRDLQSTNGTYVNGRPVSQAPLQNNDIVHVAHEEFRFVSVFDVPGAGPGDSSYTEPVKGKVPPSVYVGTQHLREMLARRNVRILYQPIVNLATGELLGYEALARGTHSSLSIKPVELFDLAERCGLAEALSQMFRQAAVQDAAQLPGSGYLFLNLHAAEMANDEIIESMRKIKAIAPPQWQLVLEINEHAVADLPTWKSWREQLKAMGMQIAYDDFGMGQSRVIELTELPPDFIKLDMQLVRNLHLVKARQDFIQALTQVSSKLGVKVIAEGIEFPREAQICRKMGCDFGQGFLFAPPQGPPSRIPHFGEQVPDLSNSDMERRAAIRVPGYGMTLVRPGAGDARKIPAHAAKIVNFSECGIAILLNQQLEPEAQLELAPIGWTGSCSILKAVVTHARKKDDNWIHGCKFETNLSKADLEKLTAYQIKHSR